MVASSFLDVTRHPHDGCQWNPLEERGSLVTDRHFRTTQAVVIVGPRNVSKRAGIQYRLCADCARLPRWNGRHRHQAIQEPKP